MNCSLDFPASRAGGPAVVGTGSGSIRLTVQSFRGIRQKVVIVGSRARSSQARGVELYTDAGCLLPVSCSRRRSRQSQAALAVVAVRNPAT